MSDVWRARRYELFDVFTERTFSGNPLAIVHDAGGLGGEDMLMIAREFNLSETVFILPPSAQPHQARVRIFKPNGEMPFAGHPTIGAAVSLALLQSQRSRLLFTVEEKIGIVRCVVDFRDEAPFAEFDLPMLPLRETTPLQSEVFAAAFGVENSDIGFDNHMPSLWTAGVPFYFVPIDGLTTIAGVSPDPLFIAQNFERADGTIPSFYLYCREARRFESAFHTRMFRPDGSEDAATGSAASAFIGLVHHFDRHPEGYNEIWLEQGLEMIRPSRIRLGFDVEAGEITSARIGGHAVKVAEGHLFC